MRHLYKILLLSVFQYFTFNYAKAQHNHKDHIEGKVFEKTDDGKLIPLTGANIYWSGTSEGTISGKDGSFHIDNHQNNKLLVISFIGYKTDTIDVTQNPKLNIILNQDNTLQEVDVVHRQKSTQISMINPVKVEHIGGKELMKAACCNLSESFETSPSIDVSFTDAITGTRQIQMLGLAGPYTQISRENMPDVRGLSAIYGLTYIPGTWIEGIMMNKGTGSVANGYESIAGQINVELVKPEHSERLYINGYVNESRRFELNTNIAHKFNENWSTGLLLHGKENSMKMDKNDDGFLDNPLSKQLIVLNRWNYESEHKLHFQFGVKGTLNENLGGQTDFEPQNYNAHNELVWGMKQNVKRIEGWVKIGKVFEDQPWKSVGFQVSGTSHSQNSYYGKNVFDATQQSVYANLLYQSILSNSNHEFRTGASLQYDNYTEDFNAHNFDRKEIVPGAYFEYTFNHHDKFNAVLGLRADYHNLFGAFVTPRLHLRCQLAEHTVVRASAGRGQRTASVIAENSGLLASSRQFLFWSKKNDNPYGLNPEIAWNYGLNLLQKFDIDYREGSISIDFYRTIFKEQVVVDLEQDAQKAFFYNLEGKSYSNSYQVQLDYEVIKRLDARLAYRWYDVETTINGELLPKPLIASHRTFLNLAYETRNQWKFDYTINWQGQKRLPNTRNSPSEYKLKQWSPSFFVMNAQISKVWREKFEIYLGAENLANFKQSKPIISSENPFGEYFDASIIWGPVMGREVYAGFRYRIK